MKFLSIALLGLVGQLPVTAYAQDFLCDSSMTIFLSTNPANYRAGAEGLVPASGKPISEFSERDFAGMERFLQGCPGVIQRGLTAEEIHTRVSAVAEAIAARRGEVKSAENNGSDRAQAVTTAAQPATDAKPVQLHLSGDQFWLVLASRQNPNESISLAHAFPTLKPLVVKSVNGWFAVIVGPNHVRPGEGRTFVEASIAKYHLPNDAFLSRGEKFVEILSSEPTPASTTVHEKASVAAAAPPVASPQVPIPAERGVSVGRADGEPMNPGAADASPSDANDVAIPVPNGSECESLTSTFLFTPPQNYQFGRNGFNPPVVISSVNLSARLFDLAAKDYATVEQALLRCPVPPARAMYRTPEIIHRKIAAIASVVLAWTRQEAMETAAAKARAEEQDATNTLNAFKQKQSGNVHLSADEIERTKDIASRFPRLSDAAMAVLNRETEIAKNVEEQALYKTQIDSLPPAIKSDIENNGQCTKMFGDVPEMLPQFIKMIDLNGDGVSDYILDFKYFFCERSKVKVTPFCDNNDGCRQDIFVSKPDGTFVGVFGTKVASIDFDTAKSPVEIIVHFKGSACSGEGSPTCQKTFVIKGDQLVRSGSLTAHEIDEELQQFGVYVAAYAIGSRCAENNVAFTGEIVQHMADFMKKRFAPLPPDRKDQVWKVVWSSAETQALKTTDCTGTLQQAKYMFPADTFLSSSTPKNPF